MPAESLPLADFAVPAEHSSCLAAGDNGASPFQRGTWSAERLAALAAHLSGTGAAALAAIPPDELLAAWESTVDELRDAEQAPRAAFDPLLAELTRLSLPGVRAALEVILAGLVGPATTDLFARARPRSSWSPALVIVAGSVPGLGLQALLPALALRRPVLLKSSSREPLVVPLFVSRLTARLPALGEAIAALTWPGGSHALEAPLLAAAGRVVAYGDAATLDDLERRVGSRLVAHGPKLSLALVGRDAPLTATAVGLARDVALLDQRGCLSVQAIYTDGDALALAVALGVALAELASRLPPGQPLPAELATVQQLRAEAELRGLSVAALPPRLGTVIVEPRPELRASPGLRTVRIHPVADFGEALAALASWQGRLQGAALAGASARAAERALAELGCTRFAPPGALQLVDASWPNGGLDPLVALGDD